VGRDRLGAERTGQRVTITEIEAALPDYIAGIEAELRLLSRLRQLALDQHDASQARKIDEVNRAGDERDRIMAALVQLEYQLKPVRQEILAQKVDAERLNGFTAIVALHRTAAGLVSDIMQADRNTLEELKSAELARRTSAQAIESGEATLAAYRRVLTPSLGSSGLIDRKG
jgi:hypothetical protein